MSHRRYTDKGPQKEDMPNVTPITNGDVAARSRLFEELVRPHFDSLYGAAYRLTGNRADAEDLVQDVCLRTFPRLDEFRSLEHPRGWLKRVLYRRFIDTTRQKKRSPLYLVRRDEEEDDPVATIPSAEPGPEQQTEGLLGEERLMRAWRYMGKDQQQLLALHDVEGRSLKELEEMTGVPQGTLKSRLHRARVRLGRLLTREQGRRSVITGNEENELRKCSHTAG